MGRGIAETIGELYVDGAHMATAQSRFDAVLQLIDGRISALNAQAEASGLPPDAVRYIGPTFVVHCENAPQLLEDDVCVAVLAHIARRGARTGVVAKLYGDRAAILEGCTRHSVALIAALQDGRVLQIVEPAEAGNRPPMDLSVPNLVDPASPAGTLAALMSAGDAAAAGALVAAYVHERDDNPDGRRFIAQVLRQAAEVLAPSGAADRSCPLCRDEP